jgi:hypothetical protein
MKTTDKILLIAFSVILIANATITAKVVSVLIAIAYLLFISAHLALGIPFMVLILVFSKFFTQMTIAKKMKNFSVIVYSIVFLAALTLWIISVYSLPLLIAAMLWNFNLDLSQAIELVIKTIE